MFHVSCHLVLILDRRTLSISFVCKNIPLPSKKDYTTTLIEKTELLCRRMRWRAFFYLRSTPDAKKHETYGFNSTKSPPSIPQMLNFENRLINMINNLKFRKVNCNFQNQLSSDIRNIKKSNYLFVPADKTNNFY